MESAHRQGILHRDIKPANVLTTRSGRPALADFGIAVSSASQADPDAVGVSIPWSPPELLADEPVGDVRSDVYSLAATLYTLLARRSPLEPEGRPTTQADLLSRIPGSPRRRPAAPTRRGPWSGCCRRGLAKDPALRFGSAEQLARAMQQVQREIGEPVTDFEFLAADPGAELAELTPDAADHTRIRPLVINAQGAVDQTESDAVTRKRGGLGSDVAGATRGRSAAPEHTVLRGRSSTGTYLDAPEPVAPPAEDTVVPARPAPTAPAPAKKRALRPAPLAVGAVTLLAAGMLTWIVVSGGTDAPTLDDTGDATSVVASDPALAVVDVVPPPVDLTGTLTPDGVAFTWTNPEPQAGDSYDWQHTKTGQEEPANRVTDPGVTIGGVQQACIEVVIVRDNGSSSVRPADACVGE